MEGARVSHYQVLERLGGGGMGVVYKALDTRLDRHVALKFLPPDLTRDEDARQRFMQEARAASALDHPNICTIYEIDSTPEGQLFIAMAYYDGETLKRRIERGTPPIEETLDIAEQMARGLAKAHAAGIVHRDVKPANVVLTNDGLVKILDFGIAKLLGVAGPTRTGSTLGTVSYMSPEQVDGVEVDARSDVWSLGAVLYEMLTGQKAFAAENEWSIMRAITSRAPERPSTVVHGIAPAIDDLVLGALERDRDRRTASAEAFAQTLQGLRSGASRRTGEREPVGARGRNAVAAAAAVAVIVAAVWAFGAVGGRDRAWVLEAALPEIDRLARDGLMDSAWAIARQAEEITPDLPALAEVWPKISLIVAELRSDPPGARVLMRPYGSAEDAPWELVGTTPLEAFRLPFTPTLLRIEADGYRPSYAVPNGIDEALVAFPLFTLDPPGAIPEEMVRVPGWATTIDGQSVTLQDFLLDRYEVTNREYKAFVDAGGYRDPGYWEHAFEVDGRALPREEAMARLVDQTGRPGPSTWQVGSYPEGEDDHPVAGVSWYEAAAYAKFAGKVLPSVFHWRRAYGTIFFLEALVPRSNFAGEGTAAVGAFHGMGPFGTYDMAGNVREWTSTAVEDARYLLGGAWADPDYIGVNSLNSQYTQPPFDRSPMNGIRLATYLEDGDALEAALAPREPAARPDYRATPQLDDDVFEIYRRMYAYDAGPLNAVVEDADTTRHWIRQRISFDAAYGGERVLLYLHLPLTGRPPYQTVVYWSGSMVGLYTSIDQTATLQTEFILRSGRALAFPVLAGTLERNDGPAPPSGSSLARERTIEQVRDVMRTIDYLETRDDIDAAALAYYGWSWGGTMSPIPLALEPRLKVAVLDVAGASTRRPPEVNPTAYLSRVTVPVLMVNGRLDAVFPIEESARPFFDMLGTAPDRKRFVVSEAGHLVPRPQLIRETLDWLDRYLGPVPSG